MKPVCVYLPEDIIALTRSINRSELITRLLINYLEIENSNAVGLKLETLKAQKVALEESMKVLQNRKEKIDTSVLDKIYEWYCKRINDGITNRDSMVEWAHAWWKEAGTLDFQIRSANTLIIYLEERYKNEV